MDAETNAKQPHVTVVYKPLPSKDKKGRAVFASTDEGAMASRANGMQANGAQAFSSAYLREENEDDDGYDPYSDRREEAPLFERNPWD